MKARQDNGYSHFRNVRVGGDLQDAGNGIDLRAAVTSGNPQLVAVGDDTNVSPEILAKVAGVEVQRFLANGAVKTIVDGAATSLADVACASGAMSGGFIDFLVRASDGTDHQALAGRAAYACVNKAGTHTGTITYTTAPEAKAVSAGTLTLAFTIVTGTNKMTIKVQPTGSLTETTPYTIEYNVQPIRGAVTIV
jgi:hypothetical protein